MRLHVFFLSLGFFLEAPPRKSAGEIVAISKWKDKESLGNTNIWGSFRGSLLLLLHDDDMVYDLSKKTGILISFQSSPYPLVN